MARRRAVYTGQLGHQNPIPAAARVGPLLMSGIIGGVDPTTVELPEGIDAQCAHMFEHVRAIVEAGGGTTDDIVKLTVYLADHGERTALNREWVAMFPDPETRPARQAMQGTPNPPRLIECEFVAFVDRGS